MLYGDTIKANRPDGPDGVQAFWIDEQLLGRFEGIRLRDISALKINDFRLMVYVCESKWVNHVYFDEVVISPEYIGPLAAETAVEDATWGQIIRRGWWNWR